MATINALAVKRDYRRLTCAVAGTSWQGTVGRVLALAAVADLETEGCQAFIATAGGINSLRLFGAIGFLVLDPPRRTDLHASIRMTNIGLVVQSQVYVKARREHGFDGGHQRGSEGGARLLHYFERCELEALQGQPIDSFF